MKNEQIVKAFGYGIKSLKSQGSKPEVLAFIGAFNNNPNKNIVFTNSGMSDSDDSYYNQVIFLTKDEALKFMKDKFYSFGYNLRDFKPYKSRKPRFLALIDPKYGAYAPTNRFPRDLLHPAVYDSTDKKVKEERTFSSLTINDVVDALNSGHIVASKNGRYYFLCDYINNQRNCFFYTNPISEDLDGANPFFRTVYPVINEISRSARIVNGMIHIDFHVSFDVELSLCMSLDGSNILNDWYQENVDIITSSSLANNPYSTYDELNEVYDKYSTWKNSFEVSVMISFKKLVSELRKKWDVEDVELSSRFTSDGICDAVEIYADPLFSAALKNYDKSGDIRKSFIEHCKKVQDIIEKDNETEYL